MLRILKRPNFWLVFLGDAVLARVGVLPCQFTFGFDGDVSATSLTQWMEYRRVDCAVEIGLLFLFWAL